MLLKKKYILKFLKTNLPVIFFSTSKEAEHTRIFDHSFLNILELHDDLTFLFSSVNLQP